MHTFCRLQKGSEDSDIEELQQREYLQKIQTYRLVRENMLEQQKQQQLNRKEMRRCQLNKHEKMQVSVGKKLLM